MGSKLDMNEQMILMRKDIKRAKIWTVAKLVRRMKIIRDKSGTDTQKAKNSKRADRLYEEIEKLKDLKADVIFKALLQSNNLQCNTINSELSCEERAIIRIGSVNFIKKRMEDIKNWISGFHMERSNKKLPECFKSTNENKLKGDEIVQESTQPKDETKKVDSNNLNEKPKKIDMQIQNTFGEDSTRKKESNSAENLLERKISSDENEEDDKITPGCKSFESIEEFVEDSEESLVQQSDTNEISEEVVIGTTLEGYQVVLPPFYSKQHKEENVEEKEKYNFVTMAENKGTEDVRDILPNIGEGFDSNEENSDHDLDYEDLLKIQRGRGAEGSDSEEITKKLDLFFTDKKGSTDKSFKHFYKKEKIVEVPDDEIKSSFMGSLSKMDASAKGKKNRMSQRARKKAHRKEISSNRQEKYETKRIPRGCKVAERNEHAVNKNIIADKSESRKTAIHPSWEASRKRKQEQSALKPFTGKRVCFDDSD